MKKPKYYYHYLVLPPDCSTCRFSNELQHMDVDGWEFVNASIDAGIITAFFRKKIQRGQPA